MKTKELDAGQANAMPLASRTGVKTLFREPRTHLQSFRLAVLGFGKGALRAAAGVWKYYHSGYAGGPYTPNLGRQHIIFHIVQFNPAAGTIEFSRFFNGLAR